MVMTGCDQKHFAAISLKWAKTINTVSPVSFEKISQRHCNCDNGCGSLTGSVESFLTG